MTGIDNSIYEFDEMEDSRRRTLNPSEWISHLPTASPYTTPSITLNTPTPIKIPTVAQFSTDWELFDLGGGDLVVRYVGTRTDARHMIQMWTNISAPGTNTLYTELHARINDTTEIVGSRKGRTIGIGDDTGSISLGTEVNINPNDFLRIWMETDKTTAFLFKNTSIRIKEVN